MKTFSADLIALLASGVPMFKVDLFAIGPCLNGAFIYATDGSGPIPFGGNTYQPLAFGMWNRDNVTVKIGLDSNSTRLTVFADSRTPVYFPGTGTGALLIDGIKYGLLGSAPVTVYTAYMTTYGKVTGGTGGSLVETKFVGEVANVPTIGITKAVVEVQDLLYRLNQKVPNRILQASCSWVLYSVGCTLTRTSFERTNSIGAITTSYQFAPTTNLTTISAAGTFTQGQLTFTSGQNNGLSYFVRLWTPGTPDVIQLDVAPIFPLRVGDTFAISEGCNKTFASCLNLQGSTNSRLNYGGQPSTPVPESAI